MSFKIKKWSKTQQINVTDYYPDATPSQAGTQFVIGGGQGMCWQGKIIFCCYDRARADSEGRYAPPIWFIYDPAFDTWEGPYDLDYNEETKWLYYSNFDGNDRVYVPWGNEYFMCFPGMLGMGGHSIMYGWDANMNFVPGTYPQLTQTNIHHHYGAGIDSAGNLAVIREGRDFTPTSGTISTMSLRGGSILKSISQDPYLYHGTSWGSIIYQARVMGDFITLNNMEMYGEGANWGCPEEIAHGYNMYSEYPTIDDKCSTIIDNTGPQHMHVYPWKVGNQAWMNMVRRNSDGSSTAYKAIIGAFGDDIGNPSVAIEYPYTAWEERAINAGVDLTLHERDLDGEEHDAAPLWDINGKPTLNRGDGYFTACGSIAGSFAHVQRLDPDPPVGRAVLPHKAGAAAIGWLGDYAIRQNLKVEALLPFPDERDSSLDSYPPQEQQNYILGKKEIFKRTSGLTYHKDLVVELSGYPTALPEDMTDWWFPGDWIDKDHHRGFWAIFAGETAESVTIGRMPDIGWGMFTPFGQDIMYGLGSPNADIESQTASAFVLRSNNSIAGTSFAGPLTGGTGPRRMITSSPDGPATLYFYESMYRIGSPPLWDAKAGNVVNGTFVPTFEPQDSGFDIPDLGQTPGQAGWTVWSIAPIRPCQALTKGGYLVGATLYFNPWELNDWEFEPGARDLTFRDSGQGWIPALPGASGPKTFLDYHQPELLTAQDEWSANRSLYGPDALLVFDENGVFVECLNSENLYPPNGKEVIVTRESRPRIIFRVYRHGTYSDYAEAWGQYHRLGGDEEIQAPMYVCYDLMDKHGAINPGAGKFHGFLDMYDVTKLEGSWRWTTCAQNIYEWQYPKAVWSPPGPTYVRVGKGGRQLAPLNGSASSRSGTHGIGSRQ